MMKPRLSKVKSFVEICLMVLEGIGVLSSDFRGGIIVITLRCLTQVLAVQKLGSSNACRVTLEQLLD